MRSAWPGLAAAFGRPADESSRDNPTARLRLIRMGGSMLYGLVDAPGGRSYSLQVGGIWPPENHPKSWPEWKDRVPIEIGTGPTPPGVPRCHARGWLYRDGRVEWRETDETQQALEECGSDIDRMLEFVFDPRLGQGQGGEWRVDW